MKVVVISIADRIQEGQRPAERLRREAHTPIPNTPITIKPGSLSAAKVHVVDVAEQLARAKRAMIIRPLATTWR